MQSSGRAADKLAEFDFGSLTPDTDEQTVGQAFDQLRLRILEEIRAKNADGLHLLHSAAFVKLKAQAVALWLVRRIYDRGAVPGIDLGALGRAFEDPPGEYTSKYADFMVTQRMAAPQTSSLNIAKDFVAYASSADTSLEHRPLWAARGLRPSFGKGRLPTVYFVTREFSQPASYPKLLLPDACELLVASFDDAAKLQRAFDLCVAQAGLLADENDDAKLLLLNLAVLFRDRRARVALAEDLNRRENFEDLARRRRAERAEKARAMIAAARVRLAEHSFSSDDVCDLVDALATFPRENLAASILSGHAFFTETEAQNLLSVDKFGCCLLDYLAACLRRFGRCGPFESMASLIAAVRSALPADFSKPSAKPLESFESSFAAEEFAASLEAFAKDETPLHSDRFPHTLETLERLLASLAGLKARNSWLAVVGYLEGDSYNLALTSGKSEPARPAKKQKIAKGSKKIRVAFSQASLLKRKGELIRKLVSRLVKRTDCDDPGALAFLKSLAAITKTPFQWLLQQAWRFHFSWMGAAKNHEAVQGLLRKLESREGEQFTPPPAISLLRAIFEEHRRKKELLAVLSDGLLGSIKDTSDLPRVRTVFENISRHLVGDRQDLLAIEADSRELGKAYPRLMAIALEDSATLHSEIAAHSGDRRQRFVDFVFVRFARSLQLDRNPKTTLGYGGSLGWITPTQLVVAMFGKTAAGQAALYEFDWRSSFEITSLCRLFPLQSSSPADIASGLANFAILLRTMSLVFDIGSADLEQLARHYASSFRIAHRKLSNLGEYVLGAAEGCFHNEDILGDVYGPFMRGAMASISPEKRLMEYLRFLVKFFEDPEFCGGIDESFIDCVIAEVKTQLAALDDPMLARAVAAVLPESAGIIEGEQFRKLKILSTSSRIRDITRVTEDNLYRQLPTLGDLVSCDPSHPGQLGGKLASSSLKTVIQFVGHAIRQQDFEAVGAALGCIIRKQSVDGLAHLLSELEKVTGTAPSFGELLYRPAHSFFASRAETEDGQPEAATINRDLVWQFWPSLHAVCTELSVLQRGFVSTEKASSFSGLSGRSVHVYSALQMADLKQPAVSAWSDDQAKTLQENLAAYHCTAVKAALHRSQLLAKLKPHLRELFEAAKQGFAVESKWISESLASHKKMISKLSLIGPERALFRGALPQRFVYGICGAKEDDLWGLALIKESAASNKKTATKRLAELLSKASASEKRLLVAQLAIHELLPFALPLLVYSRLYLDALNLLAKSVGDFAAVYRQLRELIAPATGMQAGYFSVNLFAKFIYRPFFFGDKPKGDLDYRLMVPQAVRLGLALQFFAADSPGEAAHRDFFGFVAEQARISTAVRRGVALFINELDEEQVLATGNKRWIQNLEQAKVLFQQAFALGLGVDRSSSADYTFGICPLDLDTPSPQRLRSAFLKKLRVQVSPQLAASVKRLVDPSSEASSDLLQRFSQTIPRLIVDCFQLVESRVADCKAKFLTCSSSAPVKPREIGAYRTKLKHATIQTGLVRLILKGEPPAWPDDGAATVEVDVQGTAPSKWGVSFEFGLDGGRARVALNERAHPSFWQAEVTEHWLKRMTSTMRSVLPETRIAAARSSPPEQTLSSLKKGATRSQRNFIEAFRWEGSRHLERDLDLCASYFALRDELQQHKAALDFGPVLSLDFSN